MSHEAEPVLPYEATFHGYLTGRYRCTVIGRCPQPDMRRVRYRDGAEWTVMFGQLDWETSR